MQQLDLLTWTPPNSVFHLSVEVWGPSVWRPKVEQTAMGINAKPTTKAKTAYWDRVCQGVANQLRQRGASEVEIWAELRKFFAAVDNALSRRSNGGAA